MKDLEAVASGQGGWANVSDNERAAVNQVAANAKQVVGQGGAILADFHEDHALQNWLSVQRNRSDRQSGRERAASIKSKAPSYAAVAGEQGVARDVQPIGEIVIVDRCAAH